MSIVTLDLGSLYRIYTPRTENDSPNLERVSSPNMQTRSFHRAIPMCCIVFDVDANDFFFHSVSGKFDRNDTGGRLINQRVRSIPFHRVRNFKCGYHEIRVTKIVTSRNVGYRCTSILRITIVFLCIANSFLASESDNSSNRVEFDTIRRNK